MNGVRRFLGGVATVQPLPDPSPTLTDTAPPWVNPSNGTKVSGLSIRKDKQPAPATPDDGDALASSPSSHSVGSASPFASPGSQTSATTASSSRSRANTDDSSKHAHPRLNTRRLPSVSGQEFKRSSLVLSTRDELLMSLLASEAMVDSRESEILSSEQVEELKKA